MRWAILAMVAAGLAGCGPGDERFTGVMQTQQGQCGPGFDDAGHADATLTVRGGKAVFYPTTGVVALPGAVSADGKVRAGSSAIGADKKAFVQAFEGERKSGEVTGVYASPRCRAAVTLTAR